MEDDTLSGKTGGWGGIRKRSWKEDGGTKRAVVMVDGEAYQFVPMLAHLSRRSARDLCSQIFLAGLESLLGVDRDTLMEADFRLDNGARLPYGQRAQTYDQLEKLARTAFIFDDEETVGA